MSIERVREYFQQVGLAERIREFESSSATVELAAIALSCEPGRIGKTLSFDVKGETVLVVTAGDVKIDNGKFKAQFGTKAKMLPPAEAEAKIGHAVGGICPFAVPETVSVYLDESLKRFDVVYPAAGSSNSGIGLTLAELELHSHARSWMDICKLPAAVECG